MTSSPSCKIAASRVTGRAKSHRCRSSPIGKPGRGPSGKFANDRSLTPAQIETLSAWADSGAAAGNEKDTPPPRTWPSDGNLSEQDWKRAPSKSDMLTVYAPGDADAHVTVSGTLPNDALLLGLFPHMHVRGKAFEYGRILEDGRPETMFRASPYTFYWQLSYRLAQPIPIEKGTRLSWTSWYDNSANNPLNPDPSAEVRYGLQSWEEMMVGFFDVAVEPRFDRKSFFVRE